MMQATRVPRHHNMFTEVPATCCRSVVECINNIVWGVGGDLAQRGGYYRSRIELVPRICVGVGNPWRDRTVVNAYNDDYLRYKVVVTGHGIFLIGSN